MNKYKVTIFTGTGKLNSEDDNVDVEVSFDTGRRYIATFFTVKNIQSLINRYKKSGECGRGLYLWASDMIIVENLTEETIHNSIKNLIKDQEFEQAFSQID